MDTISRMFSNKGMDPSTSTTHDSTTDTPELSPSKLECQTPTFKEGSKRATVSSSASQNLDSSQNPYNSKESEDKNTVGFSLLKQLFAGPENTIDEVREPSPQNESPEFWRRIPEMISNITHECFADEKHILYCLDCKEFVCELCFKQSGQKKHSPDCKNETGPCNLADVSQHVIRCFLIQHDEIKLLQNKLDVLMTTDPFSRENTDIRGTAVSNTATTHSKIYRQGCDLIENVFFQLRTLIDKVQLDFKRNFKQQLIRTYRSKLRVKADRTAKELSKLDEYVAYINTEFPAVREKGKHQVIIKQLPKLDELRERVTKLDSNLDKVQRKSHHLVECSDLQITLRQDMLSKMAKQMLNQCIKVNILGDPEPKVKVSGLSNPTSGTQSGCDSFINSDFNHLQKATPAYGTTISDIDSEYKRQILSQVFQPEQSRQSFIGDQAPDKELYN